MKRPHAIGLHVAISDPDGHLTWWDDRGWLAPADAVQAARDAANTRDNAQGAATTTAVSNAASQAQLARLRPEDFYAPRHAVLCEAMQAIRQREGASLDAAVSTSRPV